MPKKKRRNVDLNAKCAEIFCQDENTFTIVCSGCTYKEFSFDDFIQHYKIKHLRKDYDAGAIAPEVKTEEFSAESLLKVEVLEETEQFFDFARSPVPETYFVQSDFDKSKFSENDSTDGEHEHDYKDDDYKVESEEDNDDENDDDKEFASIKKLPHSKKTNKCGHCGKSFTSSRGLNAHIKLMHSSERKYKCNACDQAFFDKRSLNAHTRSEHAQYSCEICGKTYKKKEVLREHRTTHKTTDDFICNFENCGKAFKSQKRLYSHRRIHDPQTLSYICEICGYKTRSKDVLAVHVRTHTGEKPFNCPICGKAFISLSMLIEHKPTHNPESRPHVCDVCGASFSRPKALYHHKHLHLGIKKFVCKICGAAYAQAAGLSAHKRSHKIDGLLSSV